MTVVNVSWNKILTASAIPVIGFAFSVAYFSGKIMERFGSAEKSIYALSVKIDKTDAKVDTLTNRQAENNYNNALQFQAIWNELKGRSGSKRSGSGYAIERMVNGKMTLVPVR